MPYFHTMRQLLHKVDVFWARNDLLIDPTTWEEVDTVEILDEEIISGRVAMLDLIISTVIDYLNEIVQSRPTSQSDEGNNIN